MAPYLTQNKSWSPNCGIWGSRICSPTPWIHYLSKHITSLTWFSCIQLQPCWFSYRDAEHSPTLGSLHLIICLWNAFPWGEIAFRMVSSILSALQIWMRFIYMSFLQISAQSSTFQKSLLWLFMQRSNPLRICLPHHPIVFTMFLPLALMMISNEIRLLVFLLYIFLHWNYYTFQEARNFICSLLVDWLTDWLNQLCDHWQIIHLPCS